MTDAQTWVTGIIAAAGALGGCIRWAAGVWAAAMKESAQVIRDNTAAFNKVSELLGRVDVRTAVVQERVEEISGVHVTPIAHENTTPLEIPIKRPTPPPGFYSHVNTNRKKL